MQDLPRLHAESLSHGAVVPMTPGQAHYLGAVLRRQPGDQVSLFNAADGEWTATIAALRKERGQFQLGQQRRRPAPEPGPTLLFAPLKRDATDLVLRMATELGVAAFRPVMTERTNTPRINAERWSAITVEAAEQCERLSVPQVAEPVRLPDLLGSWDSDRPLLVALERARDHGDPSVSIAAWRADAARGIQPALLVGPEGGFSPSERTMLRRCPFVVVISLGRLILRAETASLAGLAALLE